MLTLSGSLRVFLAVKGRIVIGWFCQIVIVGVRVVFPRFHRSLGPPWS